MIPHGRHIYEISSGMVMTTMCAYPPSQHALPHWKCVLRCCYNCPRIDFPDQESDRNNYNASTYFNTISYLSLNCTVYIECKTPTRRKETLSFVFSRSGYCAT